VSATVVEFPRHQAQERPLTYSQLSRELGVSVRFLRYRYREGMPSEGLDYAGRRLSLAVALPEVVGSTPAKNGKDSVSITKRVRKGGTIAYQARPGTPDRGRLPTQPPRRHPQHVRGRL
jgi:hypothetical protein